MTATSFADIEDKHGFHGKPLGGRAETVLAHIEAQIVNKGATTLIPKAPTCTMAPADVSNLRLAEPPAYTKGQKVRGGAAHCNTTHNTVIQQSTQHTLCCQLTCRT